MNPTPARLGATVTPGAVDFLLWAPEARTVEVAVEQRGVFGLPNVEGGYFGGSVPGVRAGDLYRFQVDGRGPFPDPASRFQPHGVHGPSQVVDPDAYRWGDAAWRGLPLRDLVFYELHTGTFTPDGAFASARERLRYLRDLGITAVELMPVVDFPGERNWGYDGVSLFAPARCYGPPDELRRLVDEAHSLGLAVFLDVVYNHFGPDGAYAAAITRRYFSRRHRSPWGAGINLDGKDCAGVRRFLIENAIRWIGEYHFDGLRLDATALLIDDSTPHFLAELKAEVDRAFEGCGRQIHLVAEDHRNLASMLRPASEGGWNLDAVWADDFHHNTRRYLTGDDDGYFRDFSGRLEDTVTALRQGWLFTGQYASHFDEHRGSDPAGLAPEQFVICLQNHDLIGNRAMGDRLHHAVDAATYRAVSVLLLLAPQTPLLFMGQEWAASTPFQFFTDHHEELGRKVTRGRRRELGCFRAFADPKSRRRIPDPQSAETFQRSRLRWEELDRPDHQAVFRLYRNALALRSEWYSGGLRSCEVRRAGEDSIAMDLRRDDGGRLVAAVRLRGSGPAATGIRGGRWRRVLDTEAPEHVDVPAPIGESDELSVATFSRPGAVVWASQPE